MVQKLKKQEVMQYNKQETSAMIKMAIHAVLDYEPDTKKRYPIKENINYSVGDKYIIITYTNDYIIGHTGDVNNPMETLPVEDEDYIELEKVKTVGDVFDFVQQFIDYIR
jgi:hypothetical protein